MVALIGLQKAPKPGNRKKENFPDCTRHQINRAAETQHTLHQIWEVSSRVRLVVRYQQQDSQKWGSGEGSKIISILPPCRIGSCYLNTGFSWGFPPWRSSSIGGFALMYHSVHVGINIGSFFGAGTDACRNDSLQQSEVPERTKQKTKRKHLQRKNQKAHSVQWQDFGKQHYSFTQQSTNLRI